MTMVIRFRRAIYTSRENIWNLKELGKKPKFIRKEKKQYFLHIRVILVKIAGLSQTQRFGKLLYVPVTVVLLLNTWHNWSLYITISLEITCARVYVNLELLVNEKCVAYETLVKILATLKSLCAKGCYLIQKPEPVIGRLYLYIFYDIFLLS